ncbi:DNA methylase N-4 [Acinetobacter sp. AG1]|uniref:site-specific DNA-methyltransferase n=1 Tax=Acinetobacter sp. AG1 TaxID=348388 RepID=UPI000629C331|nr:site-specific DNA-methyltransferase [Acinetobacter sp. AG1]KKW75116.1 DNA methylase N-4 [Acinetobacter sp. AG1]
MSKQKTKLELTWIGKDKRPRLEPRILLEDPSKSYHAKNKVTENDVFDNKLIFGDNLLALKALEREYAGQVKCIFIDPPYNTGSAFTHYEDGLEHSIWLGLMRDRLELLKLLLAENGSIWISIDDNESHYLKVLCDEIFGRANFIANVVWQKRTSPDNRLRLGAAQDHILVYGITPETHKSFNQLDISETRRKAFTNPDNDPRGPWASTDCTAQAGHATASQFYTLTTPGGRVIDLPKDLCWRYTKTRMDEEISAGRIWFGKDGKGVPRKKTYLSEVQGQNAWSWWANSEVGHNQEAKKEIKILFDGIEAFDTPKPERLIQRILKIATQPGDLVLDSFAGSGTTGAVAQKMGRRWIMVELGEHCHTHIIPRLQKVIDGEDKGGVTESIGWQGGGGYRYYKLAPSLMKKDQWSNWVINPEYNQEMLVEAMCKLEGYTYTPSETEYWNHGKGSETDFIYVTTQTLTDQQLQAISEEVGEGRTLLIIASAWRSNNIDRFINLTLKKIPNSIIKACEWGHDDYSLNVQNLPMSEPDIEEKPKAKKVKNTQEQSQVTGDLFGDQT